MSRSLLRVCLCRSMRPWMG